MRTFLRRLGWVVMVAGVVLIAWGFATWRWGDPVTSLYTRWEQRQLADTYEQIVVQHRLPTKRNAEVPARGPTPEEIRRAAKRMRKGIDVGKPIGRIVVDRLGLNMIVVNGTDSGSLRKGPGRDPRTFMPGEGELVYIAGHRTTFAAPFAHIDRLRAGDRVVLEMPYGRFVYSVTRSVIVPADDLDRLRSRGREQIALQACHPRFSARERYIVYALPSRAR